MKRMIDELISLPKSPHDDAQDAAALAIPPMAGIIGAAAAILNPKLKDAHVEIPRKPDVFRPTKSMLDILSERIDSDLNQRLTEFGKKNGFPVVFVFYQTIKDEDGVSMTEEQKNCPYCHNLDGHGTDLFECNNKNADARIELDENVISFDNSDGQYTYGTFKINYCPKCGRKLEE